jgi:uncharacterized membrane protein
MAEEDKQNPNTSQAENGPGQIDQDKVVAAQSYAWILCLVPLLGRRESKFAQFHAKQGFVLFVLELVGSLVFWFPVFGQLLLLVFVVISVMGIVKALNGEWWKVPFIYEWSKKINI